MDSEHNRGASDLEKLLDLVKADASLSKMARYYVRGLSVSQVVEISAGNYNTGYVRKAYIMLYHLLEDIKSKRDIPPNQVN